jgi:hypothetical protein
MKLYVELFPHRHVVPRILGAEPCRAKNSKHSGKKQAKHPDKH